jgi:hypothetical protein
VKRSVFGLAVLLLLAGLSVAVFGLRGACPVGCEDPSVECTTLCLDCVCCPNGALTFQASTSLTAQLVVLSSACRPSAATPASLPPGEILHIPKLALL